MLILVSILLLSYSNNLNSTPQSRIDNPKKGVAFNKLNVDFWKVKFELLNPSWHYSWNWELIENYPEEVDFVPMIWGAGNVTDEIISYLRNLAKKK